MVCDTRNTDSTSRWYSSSGDVRSAIQGEQNARVIQLAVPRERTR